MRRWLVVISATVLMSGAAFAEAQRQPSAPPNASHAAGHDAQSGEPATAPTPESRGPAADTGDANKAIADEARKQKR